MKCFLRAAFWLLFFAAVKAGARVAALDEVPLVYKKVLRETQVAADGTTKEKWFWRLKLQRQDARENVGSRSIRYYKNFEEVKILKAGTRTRGAWRALTDKDIQERGVNEDNPGFSSLHEYVLSFPDVQEGSELEFEYEVTTKAALEPGFWGQSYILDAGAYEQFTWVVKSAVPLSSSWQDPNHNFDVKKSADLKEVRFQTKKPLVLAMADEDDSHLSEGRKIILLAGFLSDWKSYGLHSAKEFESRLSGSLARDDEAYAKSLLREKDPAARIQKVLKKMHTKLRYFGDWRASEQMYVPRSLDEINRTLYGDCKDFALVAIKMLKLAGLEARPVVILSSEDSPGEFLYKIPTDNSFNHVIIRVSDGVKAWWVDPTNPAARVNFLSDEIAGRLALVLDSRGSEMLPVRSVQSDDYRTVTVAEVLADKNGQTKLRLVTRYNGFSPVSAGEQLKTDGARSYVEEHVQRVMPLASLADVKVEKIDLDRDSGDLKGFSVIADFENFWVKTSSGLGFSPVREDAIERFRNLPLKERGGDVMLGKVYTYEETFHLKGQHLQGDTNLDCQVKSPWLDFEQKILQDKEGLIFRSTFALKQAELKLGAETLAPAQRLQKELRACAGRQLLLLKNL